ncbi:MAG TPA: hypothetical protein VHB77_06565 [Planctomycetaceae bacterium]|nr:hypothetical protein [Planctomycetaceae bacterium]
MHLPLLFRCCLAAGLLLPLVLLMGADEPLVSGRAVGDKMPQFYVRAVTGPLMNRSVCYVCRNGERPVAMVFLRSLGPNVDALLKDIDQAVDRNRAAGLRGVGILVGDDQRDAVSKLQTLSFDNMLTLPLAVAPSQIELATNQNLHSDADVTVVLYRKLQVESRFAFRQGELDKTGIERVHAAIEKLLVE